MISVRRLLLAAALLAVASCGGDGTGPTAGTLKVVLTTPNAGQDGAIMLTVSAPSTPNAVTAAPGLALWGGPVQTANAKIVLTGTLPTGTILTLDVDDVNRVAEYTASIQQVAASTGYALRSLAGYSLAVTK